MRFLLDAVQQMNSLWFRKSNFLFLFFITEHLADIPDGHVHFPWSGWESEGEVANIFDLAASQIIGLI